jgi:GT2 family glycosyltransferase
VKLSVLIPTYDTAEMTLACCASVMAALPADAEVIVIDDASRDDTIARMGKAFPSIVLVPQRVNRGYSSAVNAGVAASRGELLLLLNSDTRVASDALAKIVEAFDRDAKLGIAGAQLLDADGALQWSAGPVPSLSWMFVAVSGVAPFARPFRRKRESVSHDVGWVSGAAMAVRRSVWNAAGPLREDFRFYAQDLELCVRARSLGWTVQLLPDVRVEHRHGATIARARALPYAPELLWPDLLTWGRGHYGDVWARRARRMMMLAAALRIAARTIAFRDAAITRAFVTGYDALRKSSS